jgi:SAM-dependent methyltransferase
VKLAYARQYADYQRWHWWFRGRRRILETVLRREMPGNAARTIVSLGCGPAEGLRWLVPVAGTGGRVVGMDADADHARPAAPGVTVIVGRMESVPLRSGTADAVLALDVLEHLDDDARGLSEAARILRPHGLLLATVPAFESLWGPQDEASRHRRRYTKPTLGALFERAGLPRPRITYFNTLLFPPAAALRWVRRGRRPTGEPRSDFEDNRPGLTNDLLAAVFAAERHLVHRVPLPIGVSLLATVHPA